MPEFVELSMWQNFAVFVVAAAVVWMAGTRLTRHADRIAELTGLGQALVGMLLLGGITSLPEIAVSATAAAAEAADLGIANILGGVALQVVIIAIGDALMRDDTMTRHATRSNTLLQAVFSALLLLVVLAAILVGEIAVMGVGAWSLTVLVLGIVMLWVVSRTEGRRAWTPSPEPPHAPERSRADAHGESLRRAILQTVAMGVAVLAGGFFLAKTGEAIAEQTALGTSFVGAILVSLATSLPEISTVVTAVRMRRYTMAFGDIFGTNIFDLMLVLLVDAVYPGPPILGEQGDFAAFAAALAAAVTLLYVAGLVVRSGRTRLRLGWDSWAVVLVYLGGAWVLYTLR